MPFLLVADKNYRHEEFVVVGGTLKRCRYKTKIRVEKIDGNRQVLEKYISKHLLRYFEIKTI